MCTWCGHPDHPAPCSGKIQRGTVKAPDWQPCPCAFSTKRDPK